MTEQNGNKEIVKSARTTHSSPGQVVRILRLGEQPELDPTDITPRQAEALINKAHEMAIERDHRRQQLKEDLTVTAAQLSVFSKAVGDITAQNAAVTITNTKDDSLGRTEMILGNTAAAHTGKLSRSQQAFSNNATLWTVMAIIAGVVVVLVAALRR